MAKDALTTSMCVQSGGVQINNTVMYYKRVNLYYFFNRKKQKQNKKH